MRCVQTNSCRSLLARAAAPAALHLALASFAAHTCFVASACRLRRPANGADAHTSTLLIPVPDSKCAWPRPGVAARLIARSAPRSIIEAQFDVQARESREPEVQASLRTNLKDNDRPPDEPQPISPPGPSTAKAAAQGDPAPADLLPLDVQAMIEERMKALEAQNSAVNIRTREAAKQLRRRIKDADKLAADKCASVIVFRCKPLRPSAPEATARTCPPLQIERARGGDQGAARCGRGVAERADLRQQARRRGGDSKGLRRCAASHKGARAPAGPRARRKAAGALP